MDTEKNGGGNKISKSPKAAPSIPGVILRIFLVLVAGGVIGAVVYFSAAGWVPYLEQRVFGPIRGNQEQIQEMAATQRALESQIALLLEDLGENRALTYQDLESAFATAEGELDQIRSAYQTAASYSLTQMPAQLATLTANQQANQTHISALATAQGKFLGENFERETQRILALLSRANQYLLHANYGLAEEQLIAARQVLEEIDQALDDRQRLQALEMSGAIEGAIADLPDRPAVAAEKLELAWQLAWLGFQDLPGQESLGTPSPTPAGSSTPTPTQN